MKLLVIIPTFNEADNITNLIENILFYVPYAAILVIDDSSPDGTAETVEKLKTKLSNLYPLILCFSSNSNHLQKLLQFCIILLE